MIWSSLGWYLDMFFQFSREERPLSARNRRLFWIKFSFKIGLGLGRTFSSYSFALCTALFSRFLVFWKNGISGTESRIRLVGEIDFETAFSKIGFSSIIKSRRFSILDWKMIQMISLSLLSLI